MERPVGRLRDKLDIAIDCLCRMSLGARSLPRRLWCRGALPAVRRIARVGAWVCHRAWLWHTQCSLVRSWPEHHRVQTWWSALALRV